MILIGGRNDRVIQNNDALFIPGRKLKKIIKKEKKKVGFHNADFFLTLPDTDKYTAKYAGMACYNTKTDTYAICVSGYTMNENIEYQTWVIRHELRHCDISKGTIADLGCADFRLHDVELFDIGFDEPHRIGFFMEDFQEIKCCDQLMSYFQNVDGLEKYLY